MYREEVLVEKGGCQKESCSNIRKRLLYWRERALLAEAELKQIKELEKNRQSTVSRCCK